MEKKTKRSIKWVSFHSPKEKELENCNNCSVLLNDDQKKLNEKKYKGIHLIIEFFGAKTIEDPKKIEKALTDAAIKAKSTPLKAAIHKFSPQGITGVILLAESHITIHTWPEIKYIAFDIFTCGEVSMPYKALDHLKKIFKPEKVKLKELKRG